MKAPKKKPFTICRQPVPKTQPSSTNKQVSSSDQSQSRAIAILEKKDSQLELQNQILATQTVFKNCYNLFKVSPNLLPELLQSYAQDNLKYRDEEFTQQADNFITKIATSKKVPKDLRAKYPLYYILMSICKIFMLNEYEIIVLGCALDHCGWKINETVYPEEAAFLKEFPGNLGPEIDDDCKRLIIYLLVITFSLKQYINEKGEADKIHAYCESICSNFQAIFNRWTRVSFYHKFNYSPLEINRKFRYLSQRDLFDPLSSMKDYNIIVDSIMNLTGSNKNKNNMRSTTPFFPQLSERPFTTVFPTFQLPPIETKPLPLFPETPLSFPSLTFERSLSRPKANTINDFMDFDDQNLPPEIGGLSRQTSSSNLFGEELGRKKIKFNNAGGSGLFKDNGMYREFPHLMLNNQARTFDPEDFLLNTPLPSLSKRSSNMSQAPDEQPSLLRFHSNTWYKE